MGILRAGAALTFTVFGVGCYSPELRDCTLSCSSAADCAAGQVCGADSLCASPELAGRCNSPPVDAGVPPVDVRPDANPPNDAEQQDAGMPGPGLPDAGLPDAPPAPAQTTLSLEVAGKGEIRAQGIGTCDKSDDDECVFSVQVGSTVVVNALPESDWRFERWTTAPCAADDDATCSFTITAPTRVGAKFRKEQDD